MTPSERRLLIYESVMEFHDQGYNFLTALMATRQRVPDLQYQEFSDAMRTLMVIRATIEQSLTVKKVSGLAAHLSELLDAYLEGREPLRH